VPRVVWGDDVDGVSAAIADLASPSLFGGASAVIVRRGEGLAAKLEDLLLETLPRLGDGARLVVVAKALDQRKRLHVAAAKAGAAIGFARLTDRRAVSGWVGTLARERGHAIAAAAVERLVERVGFDLGRIDDEIEKLSLFVGPGKAIEVAHVERLVASTRQHAVDELTDRLARRDPAGAVRAFRHLVDEGEAPLRILAFLATNLRRALHVSELAAAGLREDEIAGRLGLPPWMVGRQMGRGAPAVLERALRALATVDVALKSSRPDAAIFETTLVAIARDQP
jgi:DNA polymerase-3 subunit delta